MFGIVRFMIMTAGMCNVNKLECLFSEGFRLVYYMAEKNKTNKRVVSIVFLEHPVFG